MISHAAAVIGAGFIGPVHVEGLRRAGVRVAGILGSTPEKSRRAAAALGIPKGYASLDELLADRDVAAVHVTSPNRHHFPQVKTILAAKKHVLCEKPLAMSAVESAELVRLAKQAGVAAGVHYNVRFNAVCHEAAARVRAGEAGRILHVHGGYIQDWLLFDTDYNWRVLASEGGALRALADIGTHWLDLVQYITELEIEAVCADLQTVHPVRRRPKGEVETFSGKLGAAQETEPVAIDTDDAGHLLLRFRGGARGSVAVSQVVAGRKNRVTFEVAGTKEALAWDSEHPDELWIGHRERPNEVLLRDPSLMTPEGRSCTSYPGGHPEGFPDTVKNLARAFHGYIAKGDLSAPPNFPTFAEGHREIVLCDAILESNRTRRWVDIKV